MSDTSFQWQDPTNIRPSRLTGLGVLFALLWIMISILQEDPNLFVFLGGLNLLLMFTLRIQARNKRQMENEGGIFGYLVIWTLSYFIYNQKDALVSSFQLSLNEVMVGFLVLTFIFWFSITPRKVSQEIVFGLPPHISNIILNLWKLSILFLFLVNLSELNFLKDVAVITFLAVGFFELILFYSRQVTINYVDLILNPLKLISTLLSGLREAFKWILLPLIFIILGQMELDLFTLSLIFAAIFVGLISFGTSVTKLTLSSGVIESRTKEGQRVIPKVIDEVVNMSSLDNLQQFDEMFRVPKEIRINKPREVATLYPNDVILHFPFSKELQGTTGVFIFHLNRQNMIKSTKKRSRRRTERQVTMTTTTNKIQKKVDKSEVRLHLEGSTVHRISIDDWQNLKSQLIQLSREEFASFLGFKDINALDQKLSEAVQNTVKIQEQIRSRIRGVPAPSFKGMEKFGSKFVENKLLIPEEILSQLKLVKNQDIEIIQGKDEYLFYVRAKK
ncbi:MAG: hypothetical protein ACXABU_03300 [Candidatus Hodarchaeales archaeon]|jgi:hypothetical protein